MTSSSQGVDSLKVVLTIGLICVLAVFCNLVVVVLTSRKSCSRQKSATSMYIVNLAVSDLILAGVTMPLILLDANIPEFTKNEWECKLKMALPLFNIYSSVCTMVIMSFDRVRVIIHSISTSRKQAAILLVVTWVLSLGLTAPQFYEYRLVEKWEEEENETELACSSAGRDPRFIRTYATLVLVLAYLLPLVLLTNNYVRVVVFVAKHAGSTRGQVSRAKLRVLRTIVTVTVVFVLLWLPYFVLFSIEEVTGTDDSSQFSSTPHVLKQLFVALSALSNPVVYFSLMPDYRRSLRLLLCPATCCSSRTFPVDAFRTGTLQGSEDVSGRAPGIAVYSIARVTSAQNHNHDDHDQQQQQQQQKIAWSRSSGQVEEGGPRLQARPACVVHL
ncbi:QRFP-like peptide receptor [Babylonia areolata]|uniref:QRFP-like peptide receptor n=1 Tax=Babylonia areolata TaxID=304850 RepID=UPI003FD1B5F6